MTDIVNARDLLRKAIRTCEITRLTDAIQVSFDQLDKFSQGADPEKLWRNATEDTLDKVAEYFYYGHRRYDHANNTLVSVHESEPITPIGVSLSKEAVKAAINSSYARFKPSTIVPYEK